MGGVVGFGEVMVEVSLTGSGSAVIGYAGDVFNTAVYLRRLGTPVSLATVPGDGDPFGADYISARLNVVGVAKARQGLAAEAHAVPAL